MKYEIKTGVNGSNCCCAVLSEEVFVGIATRSRDQFGPHNDLVPAIWSRMDKVVWAGESFRFPGRGIVTLRDGELLDF